MVLVVLPHYGKELDCYALGCYRGCGVEAAVSFIHVNRVTQDSLFWVVPTEVMNDVEETQHGGTENHTG